MGENWRRESDFLTTGEVASLLNISRSTVARKYDKGVFTGKTNAITGERLIDRQSVTEFIERHGLDMPEHRSASKHIAFVTSDPAVQKLVDTAFGHDKRVELHALPGGCDALVFCSKQKIDVLMLDEFIPDLPCTDVIKHIRKAVGDAVKIACFRKESHGSEQPGVEAVRSEIDHEFFLDTLNQSSLEEVIYQLLDMPKMPIMDDDKHAHHRSAKRLSVHMPAKVRVQNADTLDEGHAILEDISLNGARLSQFRLSSGHVPGNPFQIKVDVDQDPLNSWSAECEVVRLQYDDSSIAAGLRFTNISAADSHKIAGLVRAAAMA